MARVSRAVREAQRVLSQFGPVRLPVPLKRMAATYARLSAEDLPGDISGMLVPLEAPLADRPWVIVYNMHQKPMRQRFTIAHELGHLLLHGYRKPHADSGFKLRYRDEASSSGTVLEEIEANAFAAELLMPREHVMSEARRIGLDYATPNDDELARLARRLQVSKLALSVRLASLSD